MSSAVLDSYQIRIRVESDDAWTIDLNRLKQIGLGSKIYRSEAALVLKFDRLAQGLAPDAKSRDSMRSPASLHLPGLSLVQRRPRKNLREG